MPRKIKKTKKQIKEEKEKIIELANDNYSYYIMIRSIRGFLDHTTSYLRLKTQIEKDKKLEIKNEMIDFEHKQWLDIIKRFLNFIIKKYPTLNKNLDFKVMDENEKVVGVTTLTVNLHYRDKRILYRENLKSKYSEVEEAMDFLCYVLARIETITECAFSEKLKIDVNKKRTIKTILTKFNKYLKPTILDILEGK